MKITNAQKQETKKQILEHALDAFLHEDYENVKLSNISRDCNIAEGTLYNYFKDKPTLFIAVFITYRSDKNQIYKIYTPTDFETLISELIEILSFYMKIDNPKLERSFKRFLHLLREQKMISKNNMDQALLIADQYIYDAIFDLLKRSNLNETNGKLLFNVIVKQVEGIFNDYLYGDIDFDTFLLILREHISLILKPYVDI